MAPEWFECVKIRAFVTFPRSDKCGPMGGNIGGDPDGRAAIPPSVAIALHAPAARPGASEKPRHGWHHAQMPLSEPGFPAIMTLR